MMCRSTSGISLVDSMQFLPNYLITMTAHIAEVYYESIKREVKRRLIYEYRCHERLKTKTEESTRLSDTGLVVELEHLKTKTRLIDKKFASVRGECENQMR
jgi:hypothetical protein